MVSAVIFDAFGTLLRIPGDTHPFRQILKEGMRKGRRPQASDTRLLMTNDLGLDQAADALGVEISAARMSEIREALDADLIGAEAYQDGLDAVTKLQDAGIKVAVCSNLAAPYADAVRRLYPGLDAYVFSFEVGAVKPDPLIYMASLERLGCQAENTVMIGDSQRCDEAGPLTVGIKGHYLDRSGARTDSHTDLLSFATLLLAGTA